MLYSVLYSWIAFKHNQHLYQIVVGDGSHCMESLTLFRTINGFLSLDLEDSRQVKILKKTTTLLNLQNMFRQKLLSSSVDRFTKR